ncbi:MAG TPA: phosphoribosylformylglycinamidine cyclo-ligase, partial [Rhodospirillaceae bacterium]|nr:phosphoribosylformylglycinamidine cyclo-ligase [Rhodospirillaceae bacterium]
FNCGIGMVVIVAKDKASEVTALLEAAGEKVFRIGEVEKNLSASRVSIQGMGATWPC